MGAWCWRRERITRHDEFVWVMVLMAAARLSSVLLPPTLLQFDVSFIFLLKNYIGCNNNKWFNSIPDAVSGLFFCEQHSKYLEAPAPSERQTLTAYDQIILSGLEFLFTDVLVNLITHCVNICRRHGRNIPHMLKCCSASESWRPSITISHLICNSVLFWNLSFTFY